MRSTVRPDPLLKASARRHELTRSRAIQALRELDRADAPVTFATVASAARISRSWLYAQPDIAGQIRRMCSETSGAGSASAIPASQRATDTSLRARLTAALDRNKQLADDNARLRGLLARALGDERTARRDGSKRRNAKYRHYSRDSASDRPGNLCHHLGRINQASAE